MLIFALTSVLLATPAATDEREVALHVPTARLDQILNAATAAIGADIALPASAEIRRQSTARPITVLNPEIDAYGRDMIAGFAALRRSETRERDAEPRQYGDGLTRYLNGLPAGLVRWTEADLTGGRQ